MLCSIHLVVVVVLVVDVLDVDVVLVVLRVDLCDDSSLLVQMLLTHDNDNISMMDHNEQTVY